MGGSAKTNANTNFNATSSSQPYAPTTPYINQTLPLIGNAIANSGVTSTENSALDQILRNYGMMPNYGGTASGLANQFTDINNPNSTTNQAYSNLQKGYSPYTDPNFINPYTNPAFKQYLDTLTSDASNRTNAMFAGAGRDLSGAHLESLGRGIGEATAPVFANEYNTLAGLQQGALNSLFQGGLSTNEANRTGALTGLKIAGTVPTFTNANAQGALEAELMRQGIPVQNLSAAESLLLPIAQAFKTSNTSGQQQSTSTYTPPLYQQIQGWGNAVGSVGSAAVGSTPFSKLGMLGLLGL
jgi:hypothetical protein